MACIGEWLGGLSQGTVGWSVSGNGWVVCIGERLGCLYRGMVGLSVSGNGWMVCLRERLGFGESWAGYGQSASGDGWMVGGGWSHLGLFVVL